MDLNKLSDAFSSCTDIKYLVKHLSYYLSQFGFTAFAITLYNGHTKTGQKLIFEYASDALRPWHEHYLNSKYADVDTTLEDSSYHTLPILWDVYEQLSQARNNNEKLIREESINYGIHKGLSIPIYGPNQDLLMLVLHQFKGETSLKDYEKKQFEWINAGILFYHYFYILNLKYKNQQKYNSFGLTKRELQCLELVNKNWRSEKISQTLKISLRTFNFHIQNANKKLGLRNKYASAFKVFGNN